jgi:hypothetical protein
MCSIRRREFFKAKHAIKRKYGNSYKVSMQAKMKDFSNFW